MATSTVPLARDAAHVGALLDSPEIAGLIAQLQETRWTGRPGYPIRAMVGLALVKNMYALKTWTRAVGLVADHAALREALAGCLDQVITALHEAKPEMGQAVAIDGSDLPAYANGHKHVGNKNGPLRKKFSDEQALRRPEHGTGDLGHSALAH